MIRKQVVKLPITSYVTHFAQRVFFGWDIPGWEGEGRGIQEERSFALQGCMVCHEGQFQVICYNSHTSDMVLCRVFNFIPQTFQFPLPPPSSCPTFQSKIWFKKIILRLYVRPDILYENPSPQDLPRDYKLDIKLKCKFFKFN